MEKEERARFVAEKERRDKAVSEYKKEIAKEDTVKIRFTNHEDPTTKDKESPLVKFNFNGIFYEVQDGKEYELPISVIEHLNSLAHPVYGWSDPDPVTGERKSAVRGNFHRFTCTPVNMRDAVTKKPGRPAKEAT